MVFKAISNQVVADRINVLCLENHISTPSWRTKDFGHFILVDLDDSFVDKLRLIDIEAVDSLMKYP